MEPPLDEASPQPAESVQVNVELGGEDFSMSFVATVPAGPTRANDLYPLAQAISDAVVGAACRTLEEAGESISCRSGCAASCRNLVAISEVEAWRIAAIVETMPEPQRSSVQARFDSARQRLDEAGLLAQLRNAESMTEADYEAVVGSYFSVQLACPFLEDESCSIYAERPITCREYLVTSPPEYCANVDSAGVERVRLPLRTFNAVARWQASQKGEFLESWVPLTLALEWAEEHPNGPPPKPGPELLRDLLEGMSQQG